MSLKRIFFRLIKLPPRLLYRLGLGGVIGRMVMLLTTRGRRTGRCRVTPLQYERVGGSIVVGSSRGPAADWFRNILADPRVGVEVGRERFAGIAAATVDAAQIADYLELRLARHPRMVGTILRLRGLPRRPDRADLERYAADLAMVTIKPE